MAVGSYREIGRLVLEAYLQFNEGGTQHAKQHAKMYITEVMLLLQIDEFAFICTIRYGDQ